MSETRSESLLGVVTTTDRVGIGVSLVCVVHCLAFPVLVATLPFWPLAETLHDLVHVVFAVVVVPVAVVAMRSGYKLHGKKGVPALFGGGIMLILAAIFVGHSLAGVAGEITLALFGSGLIIAAHWQNSRLGRRCSPCDNGCKVC